MVLSIAFAKGRTLDDVRPLWARANLPYPMGLDESRSLVAEVDGPLYGAMRFLLAKPSDVPTYVSLGVADLGVVGSDVLLETSREVHELLEFDVPVVKLCVAGKDSERWTRPRRIATKYPKLAEHYFRGQGISVEIIQLSGSIELAPVIGLADRIFDLVQSGRTLAENGLVVFADVMEISVRLVANRSSYRMKHREIDRLCLAFADGERSKSAR